MFIAQSDGLPFQSVGEREFGGAVDREGEHRLQIGQVVGTGIFTQDKQAIDVGVRQRLNAGVVVEQCQIVCGVFGFNRLVLQLEPRPLQQQQRPAKVGDGIFEWLVFDSVQVLFELGGSFFQAGERVLVIR